MKTIYYFNTEKFGENEGMFDNEGKLIDCWASNDANWRSEYFNGFMKELGIDVKRLPQKLEKKALKQIQDHFGYDESDEG